MGAYAVVRFTHEGTTQSKRQLQAEILEMRTADMGFRDIAKALGCSQRYAWKMYEEAINAIIAPNVEILRKQEGERLDAMLVPLMGKILEAKKAAEGQQKYEAPIQEIQAALKVSERRSRIFGLDVPIKVAPGPLSGPLELQQLNLSAMSTEELAQFRNLLSKAMPSAEAEDDGYGGE